MKYLVLLVLMASGPAWKLLNAVRDRNKAVAAAAAAYAHGHPDRAATAFAAALAAGAPRAPDPRLLLNLGNAQARDGQQEAARATYGRLLKGSPAEIGSVARQQLAVLAARQGELAQALSLLRQALLLDPHNAGARFNYEVLSEYLTKKPNRPKITPPPKAATPNQPKPSPEKAAADKTRAADKAGTDRQGEINDSKPAPAAPNTPLAQRPAANGRPDAQRPDAAPGNATPGGGQPGAESSQPMASGEQPGTQRGLDRTSPSPNQAAPGRANRPGTDAATPADRSLQTQRERLQAMSLSPAQARQLLETLRAQEQQYLQQLTHPAPQKPDPNKPTW